jgi:hypothetical protein
MFCYRAQNGDKNSRLGRTEGKIVDDLRAMHIGLEMMETIAVAARR